MNEELLENLTAALYDVSEKINALNNRLDNLDIFKSDISKEIRDVKQAVEYVQGAIENTL